MYRKVTGQKAGYMKLRIDLLDGLLVKFHAA
jgi:hypothetical protein